MSESELDRQVGGSHYTRFVIQPAEFIYKNRKHIGWMEGTAIKYICRWKLKNGTADLDKAIHILELLKELDEMEYNE